MRTQHYKILTEHFTLVKNSDIISFGFFDNFDHKPKAIIQMKIYSKGFIHFSIGFDMKTDWIKIKIKSKNYSKKIYSIEQINLQVESGDLIEIIIKNPKSDSTIYITEPKFINWSESCLNKISVQKKVKYIILQTPFIKSIGYYLKKILEQAGFEVEIRYRMEIKDCLNSDCQEVWIILYNSESHGLLPIRYIFYQIEQPNSKFLTKPKYLERLKYMILKAEQVWQYSRVAEYVYIQWCESKLRWVPLPYVSERIDSKYLIGFGDCEYDVFFYGTKNSRRELILNELSKYFNVKIGWGIYGEEKNYLISRSKIILNLHYYEEAGLETCRINEILDFNKIIISENSPKDIENMELYKHLVVFVDEIDKDINELVNLIKYYLVKLNYENFLLEFKTKKKSLEKSIGKNFKNIFENNGLKNSDNCVELEFEKYPILFHKYNLGIGNYLEPIEYLEILDNIDNYKKYILHIHCFNINYLDEYFKELIDNYLDYFSILITWSAGELTNPNPLLVYLKTKNKGADIGGKICAINYLREKDVQYEYVLFVHSKSDSVERKNFLAPFIARQKLIIELISNPNTPVDAIFGNYNNFEYSKKLNFGKIYPNNYYLKEFLSWLGIEYDINKTNWFNGTNTYIFSFRLINWIFGENRINQIYNILNYSNSFDLIWYRTRYNIKSKEPVECFQNYKNTNRYGNCWEENTSDLRNGCIEHMFERAWINIIQHLNFNWLILPCEKIFDFYSIKLNAIFFPQFHNSPENNRLWGNGFTEWTLLKPFPDKITIRNKTIDILKPHPDIGYYSLDSINTFKKQCEMAKTYGLSGFVIYHYWFGNSHSVLNKVEQHLLTGQIDFPFCFSWANEPWTSKWDGLNDKILIEQEYEESNNYTHIEYLSKFFLMPNYIKNSQGACIFYVYNYTHILPFIKNIQNKWNKYLDKLGIQIQIISTANALKTNRINMTKPVFNFLPLSVPELWKTKVDSEIIINNNKEIIKTYFQLDYLDIIRHIDSNKIFNANCHYGIPLGWNNIIRRKGLVHLQIENFNITNLEKLILKTLSKIILKYKNCTYFNENNILDNILIINAWNEWNEQAVLEPTCLGEYELLEFIGNFKKLL